MITITFILVAILAGYICFNFINGGSNMELENAKMELSMILDRLFLSTPLHELMGDDRECQLTVRFKVTDNYEMTNLKIDGGNNNLVNYVYGKLSEDAKNFAGDIEPSKYDLKLRFVLR